MVGADEHDLGPVPVFVHFQDHVGFDDLGIIQVQTVDLFLRVIVDRGGDGKVTTGHGDMRIRVGDLHDVFLFWLLGLRWD